MFFLHIAQYFQAHLLFSGCSFVVVECEGQSVGFITHMNGLISNSVTDLWSAWSQPLGLLWVIPWMHNLTSNLWGQSTHFWGTFQSVTNFLFSALHANTPLSFFYSSRNCICSCPLPAMMFVVEFHHFYFFSCHFKWESREKWDMNAYVYSPFESWYCQLLIVVECFLLNHCSFWISSSNSFTHFR